VWVLRRAAEILILHHQLAVLQRHQARRPMLSSASQHSWTSA